MAGELSPDIEAGFRAYAEKLSPRWGMQTGWNLVIYTARAFAARRAEKY